MGTCSVKGLLASLVVLSMPLGSASAAEAGKTREPIRVGFITALTGPLAANGKDMLNGMQLFLEERGYKLAGREVKLLVEDDAGVPATGLTKARSLVEGQGAHVLVGPLSAAVGYAVAPYVTDKKFPTLYPVVSAEDITQRKRSPYVVRVGWTSAQATQPFGQWVYDNLKYRKVAIISYDFAFGWEAVAGFQRTFQEAGGQVVQKLWAPLGTTDFGPYLAQLRRDVDAVFAQFSGSDALRFAKQYQDSGLKGRLPLIGGGTFTDEHVLRSMGDEVLGVITALTYSAAADNPANQRFVKAYEAKFSQQPSYYSDGTYVAGLALQSALEAIGGDIEDRDRFLAALNKLNLTDAPRGPMKMDAYGNPIENVYVRKVERVNGRLQNTVIKVFPQTSQFWTYDPEKFLKDPVYSRDYPPCNACGKTGS